MKNKFFFGLVFTLILLFSLVSFISAINPEEINFASDSIEQRAKDISKQIEIYIKSNPDLTLEDLRKDPLFNEIAVQPVGETGYTYLIARETGILEFHPDPDIKGTSYNSFKDEFFVIWDIVDRSVRPESCVDSDGFYTWRDINDKIRDKYTYHSCVDGKTADGISFFVGASTYLDEYSKVESVIPIWAYVIIIIGVILVLIFLGIFLKNKEQFGDVLIKKIFFGRINKRFMIIFIILMLVLFFLGFFVINFQNNILEKQSFDSILDAEDDFANIYDENVRTLSSTLEVILQDDTMKDIYLEGDREKLFEYGKPIFDKLEKKYGITHFYFIDIDGITFVRLHNKDIFGDEVERATFLKAKKTGDVAVGFELGKTAYALRVVMPYYDDGKLIGYVELGQEVDRFLSTMKKEGINDFSLVVDKDSLSEIDWRDFRKNSGLEDNWDDLADNVVISSTTQGSFPCFSSENFDVAIVQTSLFGTFDIDEKTFVCGGFGIIDASDRKSGAIFSLIDISEEKDFIYNTRIIFLGVLFFIMIIFIWIGVYVSGKISKPIIELDLAERELESGNFNTRVDIRTGDELEELGNSFNKTTAILGGIDKDRKEIDSMKTQFMSITSHELRSPMTPMRAQLQMLMGDYFGKLNSEQKKSLDIVLRNTERLDNLIKDFLEISRMESGRLSFNFVNVSLNSYITNLIKEMEGFLPEKNIKIKTFVPELPIMQVDPDRAMQVLRNLLSNAKKFSNPNSEIVVKVLVSKNELLFSVKDSGVGIAVKDYEKVFEPFYQADNMYQHKSGGTGLGLAISKGIIKSQNGNIWFESELGKGTTFYFTIPFDPVREIKPITLLFSSQSHTENKLKVLFQEFLGPIGETEFVNLSKSSGIKEDVILKYIEDLVKKGILSSEKSEEFKNKILLVIRGTPTKRGSKNLTERDLVKKQKNIRKVSIEDISKKRGLIK